MRDVYIVGVGMIRFGKYLDRSVRCLAAEALTHALDDGVLSRDAIDAVYFSNSNWGFFDGQHSIKGQVIMRDMGIGSIPVTNVENACASGGTALHHAWLTVASGHHECCAALGAEKIYHEDKIKVFQSFWGGMDVEKLDDQMQAWMDLLSGIDLAIPEEARDGAGKDRSPFLDVYSAGCRWHMATYGTTREQLALISSKNHFHSSLNPYAQFQNEMSMDEILAARSVSWPLTVPMCAPIGDGAAAAILCSGDYLKRLSGARPIRIRASVLGSGTLREAEDDRNDIAVHLSGKAYEMSGCGPGDIDLAEVHDATSFGELHQTEALGFCEFGEGGVFAESGATRLGGKLPINTSGGLESRGHPIGASGLGQVHELVTQLRHEAGNRQVESCRLALAENGGGTLGFEEAAMSIHILERI